MSKKKAINLAIAALVVCLVVLLCLVFQTQASFWRSMLAVDRIEIKTPEIHMRQYSEDANGRGVTATSPAEEVVPSKKIILTGEEATKAARLLRFEWCVGHPMCLSGAQIRFYEGTNLLTEAGMCVDLLLIDGKWYRPNPSGQNLLSSWYERLRQME